MATPEPGDQPEARSIRYRAEDLAADVGISVPLLRSYQSKGLLPPPRHEGRVAWYGPHHLTDGDRYSDADVRFVRNVLALLEVGLSLEDLMRIARRQLEVSDALGRDVMDAWSQLVGARLRRPPRPGREAEDHHTDHAARVAASIRALAAIVGQLVAYRVERAVLDAAQAEIEAAGTEAERDALARSLASPFPA
jgi:DNA-binding transcriptional MerR regulator